MSQSVRQPQLSNTGLSAAGMGAESWGLFLVVSLRSYCVVPVQFRLLGPNIQQEGIECTSGVVQEGPDFPPAGLRRDEKGFSRNDSDRSAIPKYPLPWFLHADFSKVPTNHRREFVETPVRFGATDSDRDPFC